MHYSSHAMQWENVADKNNYLHELWILKKWSNTFQDVLAIIMKHTDEATKGLMWMQMDADSLLHVYRIGQHGNTTSLLMIWSVIWQSQHYEGLFLEQPV